MTNTLPSPGRSDLALPKNTGRSGDGPVRVGLLDVGSNSAHLRVIDAYPGGPPLPVYRLKRPTRLAEAIGSDGELSPEGIRRLEAAVRATSLAARRQRVDELIVLATTTLRDATNTAEIRRRILRASAVEPLVLTGEEEAALTFLAVRRWLGWSAGSLLVLDVGGGSTEVACGPGELPTWAISVPLGAGRLTRELLPRHPARPADVKRARRHAAEVFAAVAATMPTAPEQYRAIGTSKTFKQLAGLAPHGSGRITRPGIRRQVRQLGALSPDERRQLPGVAGSRARQILAGAIIVEAALTALRLETVDVVDWAVREGILLRRLPSLRPT